MSFAVIETGGKQYLVKEGDTITVEKFAEDSKAGDAVTFDKVLLVDSGADTKSGAPYVSGAAVTGEIVSVGRLPKVTVIHFRAKSRYFKKNGHRQPFTKVKITKLP